MGGVAPGSEGLADIREPRQFACRVCWERGLPHVRAGSLWRSCKNTVITTSLPAPTLIHSVSLGRWPNLFNLGPLICKYLAPCFPEVNRTGDEFRLARATARHVEPPQVASESTRHAVCHPQIPAQFLRGKAEAGTQRGPGQGGVTFRRLVWISSKPKANPAGALPGAAPRAD